MLMQLLRFSRERKRNGWAAPLPVAALVQFFVPALPAARAAYGFAAACAARAGFALMMLSHTARR